MWVIGRLIQELGDIMSRSKRKPNLVFLCCNETWQPEDSRLFISLLIHFSRWMTCGMFFQDKRSIDCQNSYFIFCSFPCNSFSCERNMFPYSLLVVQQKICSSNNFFCWPGTFYASAVVFGFIKVPWGTNGKGEIPFFVILVNVAV